MWGEIRRVPMSRQKERPRYSRRAGQAGQNGPMHRHPAVADLIRRMRELRKVAELPQVG